MNLTAPGARFRGEFMDELGSASVYDAASTCMARTTRTSNGCGARRNYQRRRQRHLLKLRAGLVSWAWREKINIELVKSIPEDTSGCDLDASLSELPPDMGHPCFIAPPGLHADDHRITTCEAGVQAMPMTTDIAVEASVATYDEGVMAKPLVTDTFTSAGSWFSLSDRLPTFAVAGTMTVDMDKSGDPRVSSSSCTSRPTGQPQSGTSSSSTFCKLEDVDGNFRVRRPTYEPGVDEIPQVTSSVEIAWESHIKNDGAIDLTRCNAHGDEADDVSLEVFADLFIMFSGFKLGHALSGEEAKDRRNYIARRWPLLTSRQKASELRKWSLALAAGLHLDKCLLTCIYAYSTNADTVADRYLEIVGDSIASEAELLITTAAVTEWAKRPVLVVR